MLELCTTQCRGEYGGECTVECEHIPPSLVKKGCEVTGSPQPATLPATSCTSYGTRGSVGGGEQVREGGRQRPHVL